MATTINAYSVSLSMNASEYIRNSRLSRQETNALRRDIASARTPAEEYTHTVSRLDRALREGAISQGTYNRLVQNARNAYEASTRSADKLNGKLDRMTGNLTSLAASYLSLQAAMRGGTWAVKLAADAEQAQIAYEVLLKDGDKATRLLSQLRGFAASTPFRTDEIIDSGRKLLAFGVAADDVAERIAMMGNISAGTGVSIEELAEILGKMRVQGRIMSEDLNQLTGRGINVLDGLANRLGVASSEVKDMASKGRIEFTDLLAVLEELSANQFGGLMARQAESAAGKFSTLRDAIDNVGRSIGQVAIETQALDKAVAIMDRFSLGLKFIGDMASGNTAKLQQAAAEAEEMESRLLLADLKAKRETQRVIEMRERSQKKIAENAEKRMQAEKTATKEVAKQHQIQERVAANYESAIQNAQRYFEAERQRQQKTRQDLSSLMSGAGAEIGTGSDIAYSAQLRNRRTAALLAAPQSQPTDEQILSEARRQLAELQEQTKRQDAMMRALQALVEKQPTFKRVG